MTLEAVLSNEQPWHVEVGDVFDGLARLPDGCLHSVVTNPPYSNNGPEILRKKPSR